MTLSHMPKKVITGSSDKTIRVWDIRDAQQSCLGVLTGHQGTVTCLKMEGDLLISGSEDKTVRIWNISQKALSQLNEGIKGANLMESLTTEGLSSSRPMSHKSTDTSHTVSLDQKNLNSPRSRHSCVLRILHGHSGGVRSLDFSGPLLFTGDIHGKILCWHVDRYFFFIKFLSL
jgi:F-box/WD-40 domain protein 7